MALNPQQDARERQRAICEAINGATCEAFDLNESQVIIACMPPCAGKTGGCALCEVIICHPSGIVSRETRHN